MMRERGFLSEATTHAKGKSCAEPQNTNTDTNKKLKGDLLNKYLSISMYYALRYNHEQEGPCPCGAYHLVGRKLISKLTEANRVLNNSV